LLVEILYLQRQGQIPWGDVMQMPPWERKHIIGVLLKRAEAKGDTPAGEPSSTLLYREAMKEFQAEQKVAAEAKKTSAATEKAAAEAKDAERQAKRKRMRRGA